MRMIGNAFVEYVFIYEYLFLINQKGIRCAHMHVCMYYGLLLIM